MTDPQQSPQQPPRERPTAWLPPAQPASNPSGNQAPPSRAGQDYPGPADQADHQSLGPSHGASPHHARPAFPRQAPTALRTQPGIIIGVVVAVALLGVLATALVLWVRQASQNRTPIVPTSTALSPSASPTPSTSPTPSASPTPRRSAPQVSTVPPGGATTSPHGFTVTTPAGWGFHPGSGQRNDAEMVDGHGNTISVYSWATTRDPAQRCLAEAKTVQIWEPGTITALPDATVAGSPFPGSQLDSPKHRYVLRCVQHQGRVFNLVSKALQQDADAVAAAYAQVVASWAWA